MNQAFNAIQTLNKNPESLKGLSTDSLRTLTHYNISKLGGVDEITAAQTAVKDVMDFDETKKKARDSNWETIKQEEFGKTSKSLIKKAGEISGFNISKIKDEVGFALMVQNLYEQNYKAIGNKESAKKATQAMLDMSYSETKANGEKEIVYGSIERALNITEQQLPIAWQQIAKQVEQKVKPFNQQYEIGQSDFKYEFKNPVTIDRNQWLDARDELAKIYETMRFDIPEVKQRAMDLKKQLQSLELTPNEVVAISNEIERIANEGNFYDVGSNLGLSGQTYGFIPKEKTERYKELREMIDAYDNPGRPIISRVHRDGTSQDFYLATYAQENSDLLNGVPVYDVKLKTMDGQIESFAGAGFFNGKPIIYAPDIDDFNKRFEAQAETAASGGKSSVAEMKRQFEKRSAEAKAFIEKRKKDISVESTENNEKPLNNFNKETEDKLNDEAKIKYEALKSVPDRIKHITPKANSEITKHLDTKVLTEYGIDTPERINAFLSQVAVETAGFNKMTESVSKEQSENYKKRPNIGEKYIGRGYIQLTGKTNYKNYGKAIGVDLVNHPELAAEPKYALLIAVKFWKIII